MSRRLLILGAGPFQLSGIAKAVSRGLEVVTLDNRPDNPGHARAARTIHCSTTDIARVLDHATALGIDGVCTFASDAAVAAVATVAEALGLPGPRARAAAIMTKKARFRAVQARAGLPHPDFVSATSALDLAHRAVDLAPPIVVKPADSSGSRGIRRIDLEGPEAIRAAAQEALIFSRSSEVVAEGFVAGTEVGGDAFLQDGRIAFLCPTRKLRAGFVVTGHVVPSGLAAEAEARIGAAVARAAAACGYRDGPLNFDLILGDEAVAIEVSPRTGGNGIPQAIELALGIDLEAAVISQALGEPVDLTPRRPAAGGAGSAILGAASAGLLAALAPEAAVRHAVPELVDLIYARQLGDPVEPFIHNGNLIAFAVFPCRDAAEHARLGAAVGAALDIRVAAPLAPREAVS